MHHNPNHIAAALFMFSGALIGAAVMAWLIPARERGLLDLKVGLAMGALMGYTVFRVVAYFVDVRSKPRDAQRNTGSQ